MSHVEPVNIHTYASRGLDLRISVTTSEDTGDFSAITFRIGDDILEKTGLTADDTSAGFDVDFTLTAAQLALTPRAYTWELLATFGGEVRTVGQGSFTVDQEKTT